MKEKRKTFRKRRYESGWLHSFDDEFGKRREGESRMKLALAFPRRIVGKRKLGVTSDEERHYLCQRNKLYFMSALIRTRKDYGTGDKSKNRFNRETYL